MIIQVNVGNNSIQNVFKNIKLGWTFIKRTQRISFKNFIANFILNSELKEIWFLRLERRWG